MNRIIIIMFMAIFVLSIKAKSQVIYDNNGLVLGRDTFTSCAIGDTWCIEYYDEGFNVFRPWPLSNYGNYKFFIDKTGKVGIHKKPSYQLDVKGSVSCLGAFLLTSDVRCKSEITELSNCLFKLQRLNGKQYQKLVIKGGVSDEEFEKMKKIGKIPKDAQKINSENDIYRNELGVLANEVKEIFPELVFEDMDGVLSVNYMGLIPVLVNAMKEQNLKIKNQNVKIDNLRLDIVEYIKQRNNE